MRAVDVIAKKRDGGELTTEEINFFVQSFSQGTISDYQASAWLMAVYLRGMSRRETIDLTMAMVHSGEVLNLSDVLPVSVDKHSSGGVGDKTTLIVLPIVAACGVPVAKMSGRGLGYSGGTLDKLEAISGFRILFTLDEFREQVRQNGIVLAGQSGNLAPADGKIYALRDVTATVSSLPLIASSIMSKKIAAGADAIVLDVKVGNGAFMTNLDDARALAQIMVDIGEGVGRRVVALLSDMNQPLGGAVGNALEVAEAIECLHGRGPADLREHCQTIAAHMLRLARHSQDPAALDTFKAEAAARVADGSAFEKFRLLVKAQGGDVNQIDDPLRLPQASIIDTVTATESGFVEHLNALQVGIASVSLGAGRERKEDKIDFAVGIFVHRKVGDPVAAGDPIFTIYANDPARLAQARQDLSGALRISSQPTNPLPAFYDVIGR